MWLNHFVDITIWETSQKWEEIVPNIVLNHIGENKSLQFLKKIDIFYVMKITLLKINEGIFEFTLNWITITNIVFQLKQK